MFFKRFSSIIIAMACTTTCALAEVKFDSEKIAIDIDEQMSTGSGESVVVMMSKKGDIVSSDSLPTFIYPYFTDENGKINIEIPLPEDIASGTYCISLTGANAQKSLELSFINPNDEEAIEAYMIGEVQSCKTWAHLQEYLLENATKIGINADGDYVGIKEQSKYKVFQAMLSNTPAYKSFSDIISDFNKQVQTVKNSESSQKKSGGGGGGGSSNATSSVVVSANTQKSKVEICLEAMLKIFDISNVDLLREKLKEIIKE